MRLFQFWFWKKYWFHFAILLVLLSFLYKFSIEVILISLLLVWIFSLIESFLRGEKRKKYHFRHIHRYYRKPKRFTKINLDYLPEGIKVRAYRDFNKRLNEWMQKHPNRKPTGNEMYRLAINSSHDTLRTRGAKGHWGRQKIRKMILEGNRVVERYYAK